MNFIWFRKQNLAGQCGTYAPRLMEYVDGRLDNDLTWRVKNHLSVCSSCQEAVGAIRATTHLLASADRREVSSDFTAALEARIALLPKKTSPVDTSRHQRPFWLSPKGFGLPTAPIAALAAGLILVGVIVKVPTSMTNGVKPVVSIAVNPEDPASIQPLLDQHREQMASDPLADTSAQILSGSVDNLPVDQSKIHKLSDADAAVLLDEEM